MLQVNEIHHGDARTLLKSIENDSIACSIWSPPYHLGKEYEKDMTYEEWQELITTVINLHTPILIPGGFLAINIADILVFPDKNMPRIQALNISRQRISVTREDVLRAMELHPTYNRYQLAELLDCSEQTIDRRLNGNNIRGGKYNTQTRVHLVSGIIEKAGKDAGLYLYDRRIWVKDPAWQSSQWHTISYRSIDEFEYIFVFWKPGITVVDRKRLKRNEWAEWGSRGVWNIPSVRANNDHEAKFPLELPRRIIKLLTAPNDIVLDCFVGSGTTAVAAIMENRQYIGIEKEAKYVELAKENCTKTRQTMDNTYKQIKLDI
ncbi:MAG: site-specific DNA-methyltransferase [Anaerolineae bacterium]|nr:site-specific DNA-methyltransferase [Anaerolineae bacterium]MDQ7036108.1 site-specific DNA-methyltransferase [Anaerolineae bacterium]